eukprot:m51a1_g7975 hypothetical protein (283) ;mRNA; r:41240-42997
MPPRGAVLYGLLGSAALASWAAALRRAYPARKRSAALFHASLAALCSSRVAWFAAVRPAGGVVLVVLALNRAGFCFFLTTFSLVVFYWAEQFFEHYVGGRHWLRPIAVALVCVNALIFALLLLLFGLWWGLTDQDEDNPLGVATTATIILISALVTAFVMVVAGALYYKQRHAWWHDTTKGRESRKLAGCAVVFCACCVLRMAVFYWGAALVEASELLFYLLGYWLPEGLSSALQIYIIHSSGDQQRADHQYVDELVREALAQPLAKPPPPAAAEDAADASS